MRNISELGLTGVVASVSNALSESGFSAFKFVFIEYR